MRKFLRGLLFSSILAGCLALPSRASAQPPVPEEKKAEEPKKVERDGSTQFVYYTLAGIAALMVLLLICMPARRD